MLFTKEALGISADYLISGIFKDGGDEERGALHDIIESLERCKEDEVAALRDLIRGIIRYKEI